VSPSATVTGVKIDRSGPSITGGPKTAANGAGWFNKNVVVGFACVDALSGVASCPSDKLLSGDGANQSVTSDSAEDLAGNSTPGITVGGINIDGHEPQTSANNLCTAKNGYCTGSTATIVLTATDVGPSGVKEIHYVVTKNGVAQSEVTVAGTSATVNVTLDGSGHATVQYWAIDKALNVEPTNSATIDYDNIAPAVTHTLTPPANAADWSNADTTVHFSAKDDDLGSGVDASTITADVLVDEETAARVVKGQAADNAGNVGTDSVAVKLDKTAPAIGGAVVSGQLGANGWYVGPVKVHFTCSDALSGVAVCPDDVTLTDNGANQSASGTATDFADNHASATVGGISIDREKPLITAVNVAGKQFVLGAVPTAACTADDSFSGVASCSVQASGGLANGVGTFNYVATATDKAGNTTTQTGTYTVVYSVADGVPFFLQPVNDTAHMKTLNTSIFKAGSTVPMKFQLKRADGTVVQAVSPPIWETPVKGGLTTAPVTESDYPATADTTSTYRWDGGDQQYLYNWSTPSSGKGSYWKVGVKLDDGQTYYVNIGLR
jgi:hypothetical protein